MKDNMEYYMIGVNVAWKTTNTYLVFLMQLGFSLIEAGTIRFQNIHSILLKNMIDVCVAGISWWLVGYGIAYGESYKGFIGTDLFAFTGEKESQESAEYEQYYYIHWLNQWAIASTCTTIVSGSVAERLPINSYLVYCIFMLTIIYPPLVHLAWNENGKMRELEFQDFAGSCIVHMMGGFCGLIATKFIGPRIHRFDKNCPRQHTFAPKQVPFIVMGTLFLWFSWFGFNCGSVTNISAKQERKKVGLIAMNTVMSASAGAITGYLKVEYSNKKITNKRDKLSMAQYNIKTAMGILSGLISITGCCHSTTPYFAIIIGIVGFASYYSLSEFLIKHKIDDPIEAAPLHLGCGMWGTIATGIFSKEGGLVAGQGRLLGVQILGILIVLTWSGTITAIYFYLLKLKKWHRINITEEMQSKDILITKYNKNQKFPQNSQLGKKQGPPQIRSNQRIPNSTSGNVNNNNINSQSNNLNNISSSKLMQDSTLSKNSMDQNQQPSQYQKQRLQKFKSNQSNQNKLQLEKIDEIQVSNNI